MSFATELPRVGKLPGSKSMELIERKGKVVARGIAHGMPIFVSDAKGAMVRDVDGNTYIDFYGGIGTLNIGHCPEPVVKAIQQQAEKLIHTCFLVTMYEPYVELAEKLTACVPGPSLKKAMFVNSGAEAVENAVKIARFATKKSGILALECAFHGRTLMTMSLTSKVKPYKFGFGPFAPETYKIPSAYCYRCYYNSTYPGCGMHCLERFDRLLATEVSPESIAAVIVEAVQGEGGFIVPPKEFLPGVKAICEKHGFIFIVDEVQTGFGRTGKMFAIEHWGIEPDLITMAKSIAAGMPLSAVVGKAEIMDAPGPGQIGSTFGGNPLSCAAGLATLEYLQKNNLVDRSNVVGNRAINRLKAMRDKFHVIGDVRGLGAMMAIELVKDRATKEPNKELTEQILVECYKRGLLVVGAGIFGNIVRMLMPLTITDEQLDYGYDVLESVITDLLKK